MVLGKEHLCARCNLHVLLDGEGMGNGHTGVWRARSQHLPDATRLADGEKVVYYEYMPLELVEWE